MPTAIESIAEDFLRESNTIRALLSAIGGASAEDGSVKVRLAASNASMLLLAASFEEFIRQSVKDYADHLISLHQAGSTTLPFLEAAAWERGLHVLRGHKFSKTSFDSAIALEQLNILRIFCLEKTPHEGLGDLISYNANNLTVREFNDIFKRVGFDNYALSLCGATEIIDYFSASDQEDAYQEMISLWESFYRDRNTIAHSLGSYNTTGVSDIVRYIGMYEAISRTLKADILSKCH